MIRPADRSDIIKVAVGPAWPYDIMSIEVKGWGVGLSISPYHKGDTVGLEAGLVGALSINVRIWVWGKPGPVDWGPGLTRAWAVMIWAT